MARNEDEEELQTILESQPQAAGRRRCNECLGPVGEGCDDPRKYIDSPIGMYHCPGCGTMQMAGMEHFDCEYCGGAGWIEPLPPDDHPGWARLIRDIKDSGS